MSKNYVIVENGTVINRVLSEAALEPNWYQSEEAQIGWLLENGAFVAPLVTLPVPASISFAQLLIGLVAEQWITEAEGRAWRDRVALPAPVVALIASLPEAQQFAAETRAYAPSEVLRMDPLVQGLGAAQGKTAEQLDAFFRTYAQV